MSVFKQWFEGFETNRFSKIQELWRKTIQTLGGATGAKVLDQPISNIGTGEGMFHGKKAILKQLTRANVFSELKNIQDPELAGSAQQAEAWLGEDQKFSGSVGEFLKMLFGNYYERLANHDDTDDDDAHLQKAQPMPPKPVMPQQPPPQFSQPQQPPPPMSMQPGL